MGLPATAWMLELGAFFLRTDTELLLKSRRVVPGRLLEAGFEFLFPTWDDAVLALTKKARVAGAATASGGRRAAKRAKHAKGNQVFCFDSQKLFALALDQWNFLTWAVATAAG